MQIFSQNENTSCVDFLQDKSTAVQYYYHGTLESTFRGITVGLALPHRAQMAPIREIVLRACI